MAFSQDQLRAIIEEETALAGGSLKPEQLVKRAKGRDHPLHDTIWGENDAKAAMRWRVDLARKIISSVWISVVREDAPGKTFIVPLMVHDTQIPLGETGYRRFADVQEDATESFATLEAELKALHGHYMRTMHIAEGLGLVDEAREAVASWDAAMGAMARRGVKVPVEKPKRKHRPHSSVST
jgi:hypothetical protein